MLSCENILDNEETYYKIEDYNRIGMIVLTDYRVLFKFKDKSMHTKLGLFVEYFSFPLFHILK